jgi:hypothetical protein
MNLQKELTLEKPRATRPATSILNQDARQLAQEIGLCTVIIAKPLLTKMSVLTQHNDTFRSGMQIDTLLNKFNVQPGIFGKLFEITLPESPNMQDVKPMRSSAG